MLRWPKESLRRERTVTREEKLTRLLEEALELLNDWEDMAAEEPDDTPAGGRPCKLATMPKGEDYEHFCRNDCTDRMPGSGADNQILSATGHPVLPIEDSQVETLVTTGMTVAASLAACGRTTASLRRPVSATST